MKACVLEGANRSSGRRGPGSGAGGKGVFTHTKNLVSHWDSSKPTKQHNCDSGIAAASQVSGHTSVVTVQTSFQGGDTQRTIWHQVVALICFLDYLIGRIEGRKEGERREGRGEGGRGREREGEV